MKKELKNSLESLDNLGCKTTGYKTPESYFENFDEALFAKIAASTLPKKHGFKVPDSYFENLEDKIVAKAIASKKPQQKVITLKRALVFVSGIAAAMVLYFNIAKTNEPVKEEISFDSLTVSEINTWLEDESFHIGNYAIGTEFEVSSEKNEVLDIPASDLEEYLKENPMDNIVYFDN
jgi:hypothetical protein